MFVGFVYLYGMGGWVRFGVMIVGKLEGRFEYFRTRSCVIGWGLGFRLVGAGGGLR